MRRHAAHPIHHWRRPGHTFGANGSAGPVCPVAIGCSQLVDSRRVSSMLVSGRSQGRPSYPDWKGPDAVAFPSDTLSETACRPGSLSTHGFSWTVLGESWITHDLLGRFPAAEPGPALPRRWSSYGAWSRSIWKGALSVMHQRPPLMAALNSTFAVNPARLFPNCEIALH